MKTIEQEIDQLDLPIVEGGAGPVLPELALGQHIGQHHFCTLERAQERT